jgi:DNA-binding transcriptional ArsR family regulator
VGEVGFCPPIPVSNYPREVGGPKGLVQLTRLVFRPPVFGGVGDSKSELAGWTFKNSEFVLPFVDAIQLINEKEMTTSKAWTLDDVAKTFRACESLFHAMGDPARQQIVLLLAEHERLNVNQITDLMHLSRPSISHHLKVLKDAGMVSIARESRENFYSLLWDEPIGRLKLLIEQSEIACS